MFFSKIWLFVAIFVLIKDVHSKKDFAHELGNLAEAIGNLYGAIDDCKHTCPNGVRPKANKDHKPTADGCGSYGLQFKIDSVPGATKCCNGHDYCYDTCNKDKALCDKQLKQCLQEICNSLESYIDKKKLDECDNVVKYIYGGVAAIGCDAYKKAQESACTCSAQKRDYNEYYRKPHRHHDMY